LPTLRASDHQSRRPGQGPRRELCEKPRDPRREIERSRGTACWLSINRRKQLLHGARGRRTEAFVEMNGLGVLFPNNGILLGKLWIAGERFVDAAGIARIQGAGRMPW